MTALTRWLFRHSLFELHILTLHFYEITRHHAPFFLLYYLTSYPLLVFSFSLLTINLAVKMTSFLIGVYEQRLTAFLRSVRPHCCLFDPISCMRSFSIPINVWTECGELPWQEHIKGDLSSSISVLRPSAYSNHWRPWPFIPLPLC